MEKEISSEKRVRRKKRRPTQDSHYDRTKTASRKRSQSTESSEKRVQSSKSHRETKSERSPSFLSKAVGTMFNGIYYLIVISLILSASLFALNRDSNKSYFGYRFFTVLTDSMVPKKDSPPGGFRSGDMIVVESVDGRDVKPGDIVTFLVGDSQDRYLTHRVIETMNELNGEEGDFVITRGDANNTDDPPFEAKKIVGKKIFMIPNVGFIAEFVRDNIWICLAFVLSLLGFLLVLRYYFFGNPKATDRNKQYHY